MLYGGAVHLSLNRNFWNTRDRFDDIYSSLLFQYFNYFNLYRHICIEAQALFLCTLLCKWIWFIWLFKHIQCILSTIVRFLRLFFILSFLSLLKLELCFVVLSPLSRLNSLCHPIVPYIGFDFVEINLLQEMTVFMNKNLFLSSDNFWTRQQFQHPCLAFSSANPRSCVWSASFAAQWWSAWEAVGWHSMSSSSKTTLVEVRGCYFFFHPFDSRNSDSHVIWSELWFLRYWTYTLLTKIKWFTPRNQESHKFCDAWFFQIFWSNPFDYFPLLYLCILLILLLFPHRKATEVLEYNEAFEISILVDTKFQASFDERSDFLHT